MPAPDPFANLSPGVTTSSSPVGPRNERRHRAGGGVFAWRAWVWPLVGLLAGVAVAVGARQPLLELPLVGPMTYAQDNMPRAMAVMICGGLAAFFSLVRCFRLALLAQGFASGLLTASALEKWREYAEMRQSAVAPPGAGELTQQAAAAVAKTLAAIRPEIGAYLLPLGCLFGIIAALAGGWLANVRRERVQER